MTDLSVAENPENDNLRQCAKCGEWKPATPEYFWRDKTRKCGLRPVCTVCARRHYAMGKSPGHEETREERRKRKPERPETKQCIDCGQVKPFTLEYFPAGKYRFGISHRCRSCAKLKNRQRRLSRYDKYREYNRRWKNAHPEEVRRHRRTSNNNRRVRENENAGRFTTKDVRRQLEGQKHRCWWCGKKIKDDKYHIDHRIPLSRGGSNGSENIVIACVECNLSKNDKLPHEWIGRLL